MPDIGEVGIEHLVDLLSDRSRAEDPRTFPMDIIAAGKPGLYSWWADSMARELIGQVLCASIPELIYVGQAGATRDGKRPKSALASRIRKQHIRAVAGSSTFALTISAILLEPLELRVKKSKSLVSEDRQRVSEWIKDHLQVAITPFDDRDSLKHVETLVVKKLDPPLNIDKVQTTAARRRLKELRKAISNPSR